MSRELVNKGAEFYRDSGATALGGTGMSEQKDSFESVTAGSVLRQPSLDERLKGIDAKTTAMIEQRKKLIDGGFAKDEAVGLVHLLFQPWM